VAIATGPLPCCTVLSPGALAPGPARLGGAEPTPNPSPRRASVLARQLPQHGHYRGEQGVLGDALPAQPRQDTPLYPIARFSLLSRHATMRTPTLAISRRCDRAITFV
jgi:hypothetical protein